MERNKELKILIIISSVFAAFYFLPLDAPRVIGSIKEGLSLTIWYAQEHVILCLIPAFLIAGAISVFISQESVIKYFGAKANKWISYSIASVSGTVLAVCSCTILPLFAGIYKRGAGLGPAIAFLYSGPAINVLAIILTARILGIEMGIARIIGAVSFSVIIGLVMQFIFGKEEMEKQQPELSSSGEETNAAGRALWKDTLYFASMIGVLVFANWGTSGDSEGFFHTIYQYKWFITGAFAVLLGITLVKFFNIKAIYIAAAAVIIGILALLIPQYTQLIFLIAIIVLSMILALSKGESSDWLESAWGYTKQIMPLLVMGVFISGFLLGSPENPNGLIPNEWIIMLVGGNSVTANLFASVVGAFMYFATLTEVPILQGLIGSGMGKGPALALLLAGPALSLPSMLVIKSVIGFKKTAVYIILVVVMSTVSGLIYGEFF
jgi:hypothetical protein